MKGDLAMSGLTDVSGLRDIRSMRTTGQRSMPKLPGAELIDLYMLRKEKDRLEKEAAVLEKRSQAIQKRLKDVQWQMESLGKADPHTDTRKGEDGRAPERPATAKKWKTFSMNY